LNIKIRRKGKQTIHTNSKNKTHERFTTKPAKGRNVKKKRENSRGEKKKGVAGWETQSQELSGRAKRVSHEHEPRRGGGEDFRLWGPPGFDFDTGERCGGRGKYTKATGRQTDCKAGKTGVEAKKKKKKAFWGGGTHNETTETMCQQQGLERTADLIRGNRIDGND